MLTKKKIRKPNAEQQIAAAGGGKKRKYPVADVSKRTYKGVVYDSQLEARVAAWLDMRRGRKCPDDLCKDGWYNDDVQCVTCEGRGYFGGDVLRWERQVKFELYAWYPSPHKGHSKERGIVGTYRIDFVVHFADGRVEYWEVKSWWAGKVSKKTGKRGKGGAHIEKDAKLKIAIFRANNPELEFHIKTEKDLPKGF